MIPSKLIKLIKPILYFLLLALATSCVTSKEVSYLQNLKHNQTIPLSENFEAVISPNDQLRISVIGVGDEKELAEPFNPFGSAQGGANQNGMGYLVDVNGDIQFPTLGKIHVKDLTRVQLQDTIKNKLIEGGFMNDPMVDVRFLNFRVFVLGTADGGKVLNIQNERCTFLEALAMAGGLNQFTRRDKIAVMREEDGKIVTRFLDPRSTDVIYDPYFMLQQNDIIVTQSFRRLYAQNVINTSLSVLTTVTSLVSAIVVVFVATKD